MTTSPSPAGAPTTYAEQLARWVAGDPVHGAGDYDSCTPDFSCCQLSLLAEPGVRRAFAAASDADRMKFLGAFLLAAITLAAKDKAVHIAGTGEPS